MRLFLIGVAALVAAGSLLACETLFPKCDDPTKPCPLVEPDYPPTPRFGSELERACSSACSALRAIGCPEGSGTLGGEPCGSTCVRASALRPLPLGCWADAGDVASARSCGSIRCLR